MTAVARGTEAAVRRTPHRLEEAPSGRTTGWWGMVLFICTESATFAAVLASYYYLRFSADGTWPPDHEKLPSLLVPSIGTAVLIVSCLPMWLCGRAARLRAGDRRLFWLVVTLLGGVCFFVLQVIDWRDEWPASTLSKDTYGSLFYSVTGLHTVHVVLGLLMLLLLLAQAIVRRLGPSRQTGSIRVVALYWYFLAAVAVPVYVTAYLAPYWI
ncbi:MAG TPA: cytochrome c oxidase subunit 3 [Nocardioides sp.]|uniref:cytochrome c oxidase subunit 3 n=1 Tax=Nocardioides sp. TaxID=35761 RepID=UPI002F407534